MAERMRNGDWKKDAELTKVLADYVRRLCFFSSIKNWLVNGLPSLARGWFLTPFLTVPLIVNKVKGVLWTDIFVSKLLSYVAIVSWKLEMVFLDIQQYAMRLPFSARCLTRAFKLYRLPGVRFYWLEWTCSSSPCLFLYFFKT